MDPWLRFSRSNPDASPIRGIHDTCTTSYTAIAWLYIYLLIAGSVPVRGGLCWLVIFLFLMSYQSGLADHVYNEPHGYNLAPYLFAYCGICPCARRSLLVSHLSFLNTINTQTYTRADAVKLSIIIYSDDHHIECMRLDCYFRV